MAMEAAFALFDDDEEDGCPQQQSQQQEGAAAVKQAAAAPLTCTAPPALKPLVERCTVVLQGGEARATAACQGRVSFSEATHQTCVSILRRQGVLVLKGLFDPAFVLEWRDRILQDMDAALAAVPSGADMATLRYRELASRQAARYEVRNGERMRAAAAAGHAHALTQHAAVVGVILEAFACAGAGALPSGDVRSERDLGAFVSLPGALTQELHADLDHLFFQGPHLPPHYVTMFLPALTAETGASDPKVGQTEFFPGTHTVAAAARVLGGQPAPSISPQLEAGDAILYDARLLHRGLANASPHTRRPILYANFQRSWFLDAQNWGQESVFGAAQP